MKFKDSSFLGGGLPIGSNHHTVGSLTVEGCGFAYLYDFYTGSLATLYEYDAILIEHTALKTTRQLIQRIQSCPDHALFLTPIIIRSDYTIKDSLLIELSDGQVTSEKMIDQLLPSIKAIHERIRNIKIVRQSTFEKSLLFDFLAYCHTRDLGQIKPVLIQEGGLAYFYRFISGAILNAPRDHSVFSVLERGVNDGYLLSHFVNATYVCSECHNGFLSYREVCPSCHSAHLRTEDIVHHFRCAHVAPLSDFKTIHEGEIYLECPKCHHELKHIGVDYDKPSTMHYCLSCNADFQNYLMKALCTTCHHDQEVEYLIKKEIQEFELTDKARAALESGQLFGEQHHLTPEVEGALPWNLFVKSIQYEKNQEGPNPGFMVTLSFEDIRSIVKQVGIHNKTKLFAEIVQIVQASQQAMDFRGVHDNKVYYSLLNTTKAEAESISQRTIFLINHLMKDNLKIKRNIVLSEFEPFQTFELDTVSIDQPR